MARSAPPSELEKMQDNFLAFVAKHPGLRIEQINKQLGTTTKDLALPIRKLIADGALKTKGKKRSTQYFASEGGRQGKPKKANRNGHARHDSASPTSSGHRAAVDDRLPGEGQWPLAADDVADVRRADPHRGARADRARPAARRQGRDPRLQPARVGDPRSRGDDGGRRGRRHLHDVLGRGGPVHRPPLRVAGRARRERRRSSRRSRRRATSSRCSRGS